MNRPIVNQHDLPAPDSRGRIRPVVGMLPNGTRTRFTVGDRKTSQVEAQRRLNLIRTLYERQCERSGVRHWQEWTRRVALKLAAGVPVVDQCLGDAAHPQHLAGVVAQLQAWGIQVVVNDPVAYANGLNLTREQIASEVQRLVREELARQRDFRGALADSATLPNDPLALAETATLHQALDAYHKHLKDTGKRDEQDNLSSSERKYRDRVRCLKEHHQDIPLWRLDLPAIQSIVAQWRNRPYTRRNKRCSRDHATCMIKAFFRFMRWLDEHPGYRWEKPRGVDNIERSPVRLPEDEQGEAFQTNHKRTYTPEQLATIATHADGLGRALIGVAVNCAFGASEVGQWKTANFQLNTAHPHADRVGIASTDADSWVVGKRPKSGVYGEHLLWPQVARAVAPFLDGREVIPITRTGRPWYRTHSGNPQTGFSNWWNRLIARVRRQHPDFPALPFGSLRDVLPDVLRSRYSSEVASMALQHGEVGDDELLKCYANTPFARLFNATRELEDFFRPFLDVLAPGSTSE